MLSALKPEESAFLDQHRKDVRIVVRARYGAPLRDGVEALEQLQRLLDDRVYRPDQRYELQGVSVCFGDVLCGMGPFKWVTITDEYGRDPTLQWKQSSINIHALTIVSKRVEAGELVDLALLARQVLDRVREMESHRDDK